VAAAAGQGSAPLSEGHVLEGYRRLMVAGAIAGAHRAGPPVAAADAWSDLAEPPAPPPPPPPPAMAEAAGGGAADGAPPPSAAGCAGGVADAMT
jgi:hypothetical protein